MRFFRMKWRTLSESAECRNDRSNFRRYVHSPKCLNTQSARSKSCVLLSTQSESRREARWKAGGQDISLTNADFAPRKDFQESIKMSQRGTRPNYHKLRSICGLRIYFAFAPLKSRENMWSDLFSTVYGLALFCCLRPTLYRPSKRPTSAIA